MNYVNLADGETPVVAATSPKVATKQELDEAAKVSAKKARIFDVAVAVGVAGGIYAYNKYSMKKGRK